MIHESCQNWINEIKKPILYLRTLGENTELIKTLDFIEKHWSDFIWNVEFRF